MSIDPQDLPVALVTGSTSGIGLATVRRLLAAGYRVVTNSHDAGASPPPVDLTADWRHHYIQADVSDANLVKGLIAEAVDVFGRLDALVNSAGIAIQIPHADLAAVTPEFFRRVYEVNAIGPWLTSVAALPYLRTSPIGAIVNISSLAAIRPMGSSIPYAASKAALNQITRILAKVVAPDVRVNAIAPGFIETPLNEDWTEMRAQMRTMVPMRRGGRPENVADMVEVLLKAEYVTGQIVVVDGGLDLV